MLSQLTVFMMNGEGRLSAMCNTLADAKVNMHSLYIADTEEFGVARIICDTPQRARKVLNAAGYRATITPVIGVKIENTEGGLAKLLETLDSCKVNIEYAYCFSVNNEFAVDVFKVDDTGIEELVADAGFTIVKKEEIYQRD